MRDCRALRGARARHLQRPVRLPRAQASWRTADCLPAIAAMNACVQAHAGDPDPRVMARQWQGALRQRVFSFFAKQRVLGRLR